MKGTVSAGQSGRDSRRPEALERLIWRAATATVDLPASVGSREAG
jgi:hypothetical protein